MHTLLKINFSKLGQLVVGVCAWFTNPMVASIGRGRGKGVVGGGELTPLGMIFHQNYWPSWSGVDIHEKDRYTLGNAQIS